MPQNGIHLDGPAVREKREALLLTQDELARKLDIHVNTLQKIEKDEDYRTSFKLAKKLARRLKCDARDLVREVAA